VLASLGLRFGQLLAQSEPPDTSGSNPFVVIIGVLLFTAIAVFVVSRRHRTGS
jgi:LPXTG-motif cell wall-anchored protein